MSNESLVTLIDDGNQTPVFCVHPTNGEVTFMYGLFDMAELDRPVYGLRSAGMLGECEPLRSFPEMAAYYIKKIKEVQSEGPYLLTGYCLGGDIAYEMAVQLRAAQEAVGFVGVFDPAVRDPAVPDHTDEQLRDFRLDELVRVCRESDRDPGEIAPRTPDGKAVLVETLKELGRLRPTDGVFELDARVDVWVANMRALLSYAKPSLDVPVDLFISDERFASGLLDTPDKFQSATRVHWFTGDHDLLFDSPELADLLRKAISVD